MAYQDVILFYDDFEACHRNYRIASTAPIADIGNAETHQVQAYANWIATDYVTAQLDIILAIYDICKALRDFISSGTGAFYSTALMDCLAFAAMEPPAEITWETIFDAWAAADLDGVQHTIGIMDLMKLQIWNKPFNILPILARTQQF